MTKKQINKKSSVFLMVALTMLMLVALFATTVSGQTDTINPKVSSVTPMNNEKDLPLNVAITATFSEDMMASTINENTFTLMQRATPEFGNYRSTMVEGSVKYSQSGRTAIFTPNEILSPNQIYGNVFTVNIKDGVKDLAGNPLSRNYMWSFTTGLDKYNTGATTSQLDQSSNSGSGSEIVPVVTASVETAPVAAAQTSKFPWFWVIAGILLLLLIALLFALSMRKPATEEKKIVTTSSESHPFGDVHPVIELEGIGPVYSKELQEMGIKNTKQLWEADAIEVANKTGAPLASVKSWQNMAELASVNDIGPQYAELLDRSGIHSIAQLRKADPDKLVKLMDKKQDSLKTKIQGNHPGHKMVKNWISEARGHKFHAV